MTPSKPIYGGRRLKMTGSAARIMTWTQTRRLFVMTELRLRVLVLLGVSAIGFVAGFGANWLIG